MPRACPKTPPRPSNAPDATWRERTEDWPRKAGAACFSGARRRRVAPTGPATQGGWYARPCCPFSSFAHTLGESGRQNAHTDISPRRPYNDGASLRSAIRDAGRVLVRVLAARSRPSFPLGRERAAERGHRSGKKRWECPYRFTSRPSISADQRRQLGGTCFRYQAKIENGSERARRYTYKHHAHVIVAGVADQAAEAAPE